MFVNKQYVVVTFVNKQLNGGLRNEEGLHELHPSPSIIRVIK
jgi:hypothetical protein